MPWTRYRYNSTLPSTAVTLPGTVTSIGWSRFQSDRLGLASFSFTLVEPSPAPWRDIALDQTLWPDPELSGVNGVLTTRGERERYRFTLDQPTLLGLNPVDHKGLQHFCDTSILVHRETGRRLPACRDGYPSDENSSGPQVDPTLPAGEYELRVAASEDAHLPFRYGVSLYTVRERQMFAAAVGATPVVFEPADETGAGVLPAPGGDDVYSIDVQQPGTLIAEVECIQPASDCVPYRQLALKVDPSSGPVTQHPDWGSTNRLSAYDVTPGDHELTVAASVGYREYKLTLRVVPRTAHDLELGEIIRPTPGGVGTLTENHPVDRFSFNVPAGGSTVYMDLLPETDIVDSWSTRLVCSFWRLRNELGEEFDSCMRWGSWLDAGHYELTVRAPWRAELPYHYAFTVYTDAEATHQAFDLTAGPNAELSSGASINVESDVASGRGVLDNYRSKDTYEVRTGETGLLTLEVICDGAPAPVPAAEADCVNVWARSTGDWRTNPSVPDSEYEIEVTAKTAGPTAYQLEVSLRPEYEYSLGQVVSTDSHGSGSGVIDRSTPSDLYSFVIPADGEYALGLERPPGVGMDFTLYDATTAQEVGIWFYPGYSTTLPEGSYLLTVESDDPAVGDVPYRLKLSSVVPPSAVELVSDTNGVMDREGEIAGAAWDEYSLTVPEASDYLLRVTSGVRAEITEVAVGEEWRDYPEFRAPSRVALTAGEYKIRVFAADTASIDPTQYRLKMAPLAGVAADPYVLGDKVASQQGADAGMLADTADVDRYAFTIAEGGLDLALVTTGLTDRCGMLTLTRDGESTFFDCSTSFPQWFEAGDYELDVIPLEDTADDTHYTMSLTESEPETRLGMDARPEQLAGSAVAEGHLSNDGDVDEFTISVDEDDLLLGQWLVIEIDSGCSETRLFEPGSTETWPEACKSVIRSAQAGVYRFQVTGASDSDYKYRVYLTDEVDQALWNQGGGGGAS